MWRRRRRLDNALARSVMGLFKTELIRRRGPWRTVEHVEGATLDWVPIEPEQKRYSRHRPHQGRLVNQTGFRTHAAFIQPVAR